MAMTALSPSEYNAILRSDLGFFAQRCFSELNPQAAFAPNWHLEVIAAKLTAVREGKIRPLIINFPHIIDFIQFISTQRSKNGLLRLSTAVGWNEPPDASHAPEYPAATQNQSRRGNT